MCDAFPVLMRAFKAAPLSRKAAPLTRTSSCTTPALHHLDDNKRNLVPWVWLRSARTATHGSNGRSTSTRQTSQVPALGDFGRMCKCTDKWNLTAGYPRPETPTILAPISIGLPSTTAILSQRRCPLVTASLRGQQEARKPTRFSEKYSQRHTCRSK